MALLAELTWALTQCLATGCRVLVTIGEPFKALALTFITDLIRSTPTTLVGRIDESSESLASPHRKHRRHQTIAGSASVGSVSSSLSAETDVPSLLIGFVIANVGRDIVAGSGNTSSVSSIRATRKQQSR